MQRRLKILVTDSEYKHSCSIIRNIRKNYPNAEIYAHTSDGLGRYFLPSKRFCSPIYGELSDIIRRGGFDVIIPVSGGAVKKISSLQCPQALLPDVALLDAALDKRNLAALVSKHGIKCPDTADYRPGQEPSIEYPLVLKSANETQAKIDAIYINDERALRHFESKRSQKESPEIRYILQRRIRGIPRGYFAIFDRGLCICEFIHERIRELPHTGGSSTCAKAIFDRELQLRCRTFLEDIGWSGPVMMEFIFDETENSYFLIEINPKFWGSIDVAHSAGVDFGSALVSTVIGDDSYITQEWTDATVMWPLDGDIISILRSRNYAAFFYYFRRNVTIIYGESLLAIVLKLLWSVKKIVSRK